jgi:hypothetical protein
VAALWLQPDTAINAPTKHSAISFVTVISSNTPLIRDGPFATLDAHLIYDQPRGRAYIFVALGNSR